MTSDLLASARVQAKRAASPVRAAAMLRIARVEYAYDPGQARITFEMALEEARKLRRGQFGENTLLEHAQLVAAAVAPDLIADIQPNGLEFGGSVEAQAQKIGQTMLENGHVDAAFHYFTSARNPAGFSLYIASTLIEKLDEREKKLLLIRRGIDAWRAMRNGTGGDTQRRNSFHEHSFLGFFRAHWKSLPVDEAHGLAHEIVDATLAQPDHNHSASFPPYDGKGAVEFTSHTQYMLFELFDALRQLDGPYAESLLTAHDQLAAAMRRFPNGWESLEQEWEEERQRRKAEGDTCGGFILAGDPNDFSRDIERMNAFRQATLDGQFNPPFEHALKLYREDTDPDNPNEAPKEFWPSAYSFRNVLFAAAQHSGLEAAQYLDRIPDEDLRLFAQIELAASLAGLPEFRATQRTQHSGLSRRAGGPARSGIIGTETTRRVLTDKPMLSPDGARIRCPQCEWVPDAGCLWMCKCGHVWNTFATGGLCPECNFRWEWTQCQICQERPPHKDWYVRE